MRSTSEDSDEVGYNNVVHTMRNKHPEIKAKFNKRIDDMMIKYEHKKIDSIDRKILKGLVDKEFVADDELFDEDDDLDQPSSDKMNEEIGINKPTELILDEHTSDIPQNRIESKHTKSD